MATEVRRVQPRLVIGTKEVPICMLEGSGEAIGLAVPGADPGAAERPASLAVWPATPGLPPRRLGEMFEARVILEESDHSYLFEGYFSAWEIKRGECVWRLKGRLT